MKRPPKFKPGYHTIAGLVKKGLDIVSVEQLNKWAACRVANGVTIKIKMHGIHR